jgi:hypothetical protein
MIHVVTFYFHKPSFLSIIILDITINWISIYPKILYIIQYEKKYFLFQYNIQLFQK